jgi:hypothetical protein
MNFRFGQSGGLPAASDAKRFHRRSWIRLEESLALRPPAKPAERVQALVDRGGTRAGDIHQVLTG